jgi:hypothetical protein
MGGTETVGVVRVVALALCAPALVMPTASAMADSGDPATGPAATSTRTDQVLMTRTSAAGRDATVAGSDRLRPPARVHLLAARVYWGATHPAYPTTRRATRDLRATAGYYDRISRGHETVRFTLTRWVRVAADADTMCNRLPAAARITTAALARAGYHPSRFNRLMIFTEQCNAAVSAAQQPGRLSWIRYRNPGPATLVHELGHNLGLGHAYGLVCSDAGHRVALGGTCRSVEYGDSWDAMGHSRASFSVPVLQRLGWAGRVATTRADGEFRIADVERPGSDLQALRIPVGNRTTYWVEYQPEHLTQVGRSTAGVTIRRQVGQGRVQILDAAPGNPTALPFPDADLTNAALPVGSSFTTPEGVRITTVATGARARVQVTFGRAAAAPAAPVVDYAALVGSDRYRVHWRRPADNGQIVLGYRVTALASGQSVYLRSTGGARTVLALPGGAGAGPPDFTVEALNQVGWSDATTVQGEAFGPEVTVTSPAQDEHVRAGFDVSVVAEPDAVIASAPVKAWAELDGVACSAAQGRGPYSLRCLHGGSRSATVTVHVENALGVVTDVSVPVRLTGPA